MITRSIIALLVAFALPTCLSAQTTTKGLQAGERQSPQGHILVPQSREAARSVLKVARVNGSEMVGILEFPASVLPAVVEARLGKGKIVAVYLRSLTTEWSGVSYGTADAPILRLSQAVERFTKNHKRANPEDELSVFGIDAVAVRADAESIDQWLALFPNAQLAYALELSQATMAQHRDRRSKGVVDVYIPHISTHKLDTQSSQSQPNLLASSGPFMPTSAILSIDAPSSDSRMISGSFSWSSDTALSGLKTLLSTLEIQTLFWNHATDSSQPKTTYAGDMLDFGATWNYAYYDVTWFDEQNVQGDFRERNYSVGAWDAASAFSSNTTYSFWISTNTGALSANMVEFSAQKGTYLGNPIPGVCELDPSLCVYPILGGTEFFSPWTPNGPNAANHFSIVAPTVFPFSYPIPVCDIPPGQPELSTALKNISASDAVILGNQMSAVQKAFLRAGGKPGLGCATSRLHEDATWWPAGGKIQDFSGPKGTGAVMLRKHADGSWDSTANWIRGAVWQRYAAAGGPSQSALGAPIIDQSVGSNSAVSGAHNEYADFEGGESVYGWTSGNLSGRAFILRPGIRNKWRTTGGPASRVGLPVEEELAIVSSQGTAGAFQPFEDGRIYWHRPTDRAYYVVAGIAQKYVQLGAHDSPLGFPISDEYPWNGGARSDFEGGYIYWTASAGAVPFYNTVSAPAKPTGPASGTKGTSYTYSTFGATASDGSAIQYRFSWGDGTYSAWLPTGVSSASHSWAAGGSYYVQAQAQTTKSPPSSSALSPALSVSIADNTAIPTSLSVTANLPTSAVAPYSAITINGNVTYNTGVAVTAGTVSISTGEGLFTASVTNGVYSRVITAPSTSRNIQVSCRDNLYGLTGSTAPYLAVLSNQTADGYRLNRTTTSRDVQSVSPYDPIFETEFFRRTDTKAVVWANFTDLYRAIRVRFDYYGPTGSLEFSSTSNWTDDPAAHGYLYYYWWKLWSWVWINNSGAAYRPGRWSCRVFVDNGTGWKLLQTESFTIGYEFAEHRMAEGVQTSAPWDPIGPTNVFRNTDSQALTWARLANVTEGLGVKWDYYEPNGSRYFSFTYDAPDPGTDRYYPDFRTWGYINIAGNAAAQKCGDWRVVVSIKDVAGNYQPTYTDYFQILEATADPPTAATSISPAAPAAGQLFTLRVSANDTTYLKKVILYWKDSTVHSRTWDNIFASSLNQSVSIGPYAGGQQVETWAEAWDTSGNRRETTHSTIVIRPALEITGPPSLPVGVVGLSYPTTDVAATGGTTPYTWSATGLPTGLSINTSTGVISGTPTTSSGSPFNVVVKVTDGTSATAVQSYSLTINPVLAITGPASLPVGVVSASYSPTTIQATGGIGPYTWSATGLPVGLSINTSSGVISGTPASSTGSPFSINITVTDSTSRTASKAYLLTINPALTITGPASLLVGVVGSAYPLTTMAATGGTGPYTWSAIGLPTGLTISAGTGVISGTPTTETGSPFSVNITATDTGARTTSKSYLLTINPALAITGPVSLPAGMVSVAYPSTAITATGGTGPYIWSATGLPTGLSINTSTGVISGTPTMATAFSVIITVTDNASRRMNKAYSVTVFPPLMIIAPASLPSWTVGVLYPPTTIRASGGTGQYTWSATGLPAGLSINVSTGLIFGTPTLLTGSPFNVNITVIDSAWFSSKAYSLTINPAPAITGPASLPVGVVGLAYPITNMMAAGGTLPYVWSATGLPTGVSIDATTGVISGTPTTNQGSPFGVVVKVADGASATANQSYALMINAPLAITGPASLPSGVVRVAYPPTTIVAIGGIGPYIWSAIGLPPGLTINSSTGVISGTPTTTKGSPFSVNITVTDSTSRKVSQTYSVIVDRK